MPAWFRVPGRNVDIAKMRPTGACEGGAAHGMSSSEVSMVPVRFRYANCGFAKMAVLEGQRDGESPPLSMKSPVPPLHALDHFASSRHNHGFVCGTAPAPVLR